MSDLIGRFLSFEEQLGRGLVKFAYYVALFYWTVISVFALIGHLISLDIGPFLLVPFWFLAGVLVLRVIAEFLIAVLSIDDTLRGATQPAEGFEAGLTPRGPARPYRDPAAAPTATGAAASPDPAAAADDGAPDTTITPAQKTEETSQEDAPSQDEDPGTPTRKSTKRTSPRRTSTKRATKKAATTEASSAASSADNPSESDGTDTADSGSRINGGDGPQGS